MSKPTTEKSSYHHGDLRQALLTSAETILRRDGLQGLTLRAVAREAGVSHGAPAHHFPDLANLLSELAAVGFQRLALELDKTDDTTVQNRMATGRAYVKFAIENKELFQLMFQSAKLDSSNAALRNARSKAIARLAKSGAVPLEGPSLAQLGDITANWAVVHGFAQLLLDGRLATILKLAPQGTNPMNLLDAVLASVARSRKSR